MNQGTMVASQVIAVPKGQIATIVTCLEMTARPAPALPARSALKIERWTAPVDLARYRDLFRAIGAPWLWRGRLVMDDAALAATLNAPSLEIHVACRRDGTPQGLVELDFAQAGECEIAYFGLVPGMIGRGHGSWLMGHGLRQAWRAGVSRVWLHSCDLDSPAALAFYQRHGFRPYQRLVEIFDDPRAIGLYPADTAPGVALL
ncbi:MAG: GNAT family N-acetyltransferase [Sphingomonadales bacterium]